MFLRCLIAASVLAGSSFAPAAAAADSYVSGLVIVSLNPQPEPPGAADSVHGTSSELNPQPEPPGRARIVASVKVRSRLALNPQPEPPGVTDARKMLPPGPCDTLAITVLVNGTQLSANATSSRVPGRCMYSVATPGVKPGTTARVTFMRALKRV